MGRKGQRKRKAKKKKSNLVKLNSIGEKTCSTGKGIM